MQKIQLGKSKVKITKLGMGTWAIGGGPAWGCLLYTSPSPRDS